MAEDRMLNDEILLGLIKANSGGGGGGTTDYEDLNNLPKINSVELKGNKSLSDLGIASAQSVSDITNGESINNFAGVETALAAKQNALTAGTYIQMDNGVISVKRDITETGQTLYYHITILTDNTINVAKSLNGVKVSDTVYNWSNVSASPVNVDGCFTISTSGTNWVFTNLIASTTQPVGYQKTLYKSDARYDYSTTYVTTVDADKKLIIQSELDDAMATKQDTLTFDDTPTDGSNNPVKSGGVKSAIDAAVASAYHHAGTKTCAELVAGLLVAGNEGNVYNMTDSGTTTADFIDGAGQPIKAGDNVGIAKISDGVYKFDLLSGFVDTTNFVQKSVTAGLLKNDGTVDTAIQGDVVSLKSGLTTLDNEVNGDAVEYPYADVITIPDAVPANLADCTVKIEPVQDLHGQSAPYVGGAGKNKLPLVLADIKAANTLGTWTDNSYSHNGITYDVLTDNDNNIVGIKATGTASGNANFKFNNFAKHDFGNCILNGVPLGGSNTTYYIVYITSENTVIARDTGSSASIATGYENDDTYVGISIRSGYEIPIAGLTFYPMIRLSTETDATFAPYTNICPISGHTEAVVTRDGKNVCGELEQGALSTYGEKTTSSTRVCTKEFIRILPNSSITVSSSANIQGYVLLFDEIGNERINSPSWQSLPYTIATGDTVKYCKVMFRKSDDSNITPSDATNVQIEYGSTATPYEPFKGKTYTIALGDTIYGGTVDFETGVMTASHKSAEYDGSEDETISRAATGTANKYRFIIGASDAKAAESTSYIADIVANMLSPISTAGTNACIDGIALRTGSDRGFFVFNHLFETYTLEEFKGYLSNNPLQVVYPLATPTTIQLTPQQIQLLKGQNTLTASTGQISVTVNGVSGSIGAVQEQVNEIETRVATVESKQMVKTSETVTLNANGVSRLTLTFSNGRLIYAVVISTTATYLALPYITSDKTWAVKVVDPTDMSPIASEEVEIGYGYIPN